VRGISDKESFFYTDTWSSFRVAWMSAEIENGITIRGCYDTFDVIWIFHGCCRRCNS